MLGAEGISSAAAFGRVHLAAAGATVRQAADAAKVAEVAKEFEANFLGLLLKQMRETLEPDGGLFPGDTGDVQGGLFDLYMGRHLADAGGVGMAAALARQMTPPSAPERRPDDVPPVLPVRGRVA